MQNKLLKLKLKDFKMYVDKSGSGISGTLKTSRKREPGFMWILQKLAKGLSIDVGANIGYTTLYLGRQSDKVIAIEPDPRAFSILKSNIKLNDLQDKVELHKFAISNSNGCETIYINKHPNLTSLCQPNNNTTNKTTIETRTLDSLEVEPNFIKMDIEGYEVEALSGALNCLQATRKCTILIEVHPQYYGGDRQELFEGILHKLLDMNFYFKYVISAGKPLPKQFAAKGYSPARVFKCNRYDRGLYDKIDPEDAIEFCSKPHKQRVSYFLKKQKVSKMSNKIVRSICLVKD